MSCLICDTTPLNKLRDIDAAIRVGETTTEILAQLHGVDAVALAVHARQCIAPEQTDGVTQLDQTMRELRELSKVLQSDIESGGYKEFDPETGVDGKATITNYIAVQREIRESILARNRLRSVDDTVKGLTEVVVNPIISIATQAYVEEIRRLREALFTYTAESSHPRIKAAIDETLLRIANRLKDEGTRDIREKVEAVLSAKPS